MTGVCPVPAKSNQNKLNQMSSTVITPTPHLTCTDPEHTTTDPTTPPTPPSNECKTCGMQYIGEWSANVKYYICTDRCNTSIVSYNGCNYICIKSHTSAENTKPKDGDDWKTVWTTFGACGGSSSSGSILGGFSDWLSNIGDWDAWDWLKALALGAGLAWAGSKLIDLMDDPGTGDGTKDRFTGSAGYFGSYVKPKLPDVLADTLQRVGFSFDQYDVSLVPMTDVEMIIANRPTASATLELLINAYQLTWTTTGNIIKIFPRAMEPVADLIDGDLGYVEGSTRDTTIYNVKRLQSVDLPKKVTIEYISRKLNYNSFTQESPELKSFPEGSEVTISVPIILTPEQAKKMADDLLIQPHLERTTWSGTTSYANMQLEPGDVVNTSKGIGRIIEIQERTEGLLDIVFVDAGLPKAPEPIYAGPVIIGYTASDYIGSGVAPTEEPEMVNVSKDLTNSGIIVVDVPSLNSNDINPRVYLAAHGYGNPNWVGCGVYMSEDNATYTNIATCTKQATIGLVQAATPINVNYHVWDTTTTISVELKTGQLESKTDLQVLNGENLCMIGSELIGFANATLIGTSTRGLSVYELTRLIRGRQGTEWVLTEEYGTHQSDELFVLLDDSLIRYNIDQSKLNQPLYFKAVSTGEAITDAEPEQYTLASLNRFPWRVANLTSKRYGNDIEYKWSERPRLDGDGLQDLVEVSRDVDWMGWVIVVRNTDDTADVRYANIQVPSWTYTEAMQIADFGVIQSQAHIRIAALSTNTGSGYTTDIIG